MVTHKQRAQSWGVPKFFRFICKKKVFLCSEQLGNLLSKQIFKFSVIVFKLFIYCNVTDWKDNDVIQVMEKLYTVLQHSISSSSSSSKNNKAKSQVLKAVYNFVETASELLLLHIARVVLMVRIFYCSSNWLNCTVSKSFKFYAAYFICLYSEQKYIIFSQVLKLTLNDFKIKLNR